MERAAVALPRAADVVAPQPEVARAAPARPKRRTDGKPADSAPIMLDGPAPADGKAPATGSGRRPKRRKKVTSRL